MVKNSAKEKIDAKKLVWQLLVILLIVGVFLGFNLSVYCLITKRCQSNFGSNVSPKMIEVEKYLPFSADSEVVVVENSGLTIESNQPVLDGATALLPIYSAVARALYPESSVEFDEATGKFTKESAVQYSNTLGAYKAVVDGGADIIFVAGASKEQKAYAEEKGVELVFTPIGREGFVFLVNAKNPVEGLTSDEIRAIYAGEITNWS